MTYTLWMNVHIDMIAQNKKRNNLDKTKLIR